MSATVRSPRFLPSPSSPSESESKYQTESISTFPAPYSPVSPSLMSVATKSYVSTYGNNQHTDEMAQRPPRSPAESYKQTNQRASPYQEGNLKRSHQGDDSPHREKRQKMNMVQTDAMDVDDPIAPTNHDRHKGIAEDFGSGISSKHDQTVEDDFAEPFLLCKSSVSRSNPNPQQHLLATYKLLPLLKTVARNDPETGEKINKLRKSYEGQIKTFSLAGRNKPVKCDREEEDPGPLRRLATISEQEWDEGDGRSRIEITTDFRAKLERAMSLQPGNVRNNAMWEDVLGHEKPKPIATVTSAPLLQPQQASRIPNGTVRPQQSQAIDKRSTRGNKRSYGDDSFVGYGEGFSDDDAIDEEFLARKRRKESSGVSSSYHNGL